MSTKRQGLVTGLPGCQLLAFVLAALLSGCTTTFVRPGVHVVQLVPAEIAIEESPSPEPSIAVNAANPNEIVASAILTDGNPCAPVGDAAYLDSTSHAIFRSKDGGSFWSLQCVLKVDKSSGGYPGDISLDFGEGNTLFGAYLSFTPTFNGRLFRATTNDDPAGWVFAEIADNPSYIDQPWAAGAGPWFAFGVPQALGEVGCNGGYVYWGNASGSTTRTCISTRAVASAEDEYTPAVRTAVNQDGTMYALYYRPVRDLYSGGTYVGVSADVVLARQDAGASSIAAFESLKDVPVKTLHSAGCKGRDGHPGLRVSRCALVPTLDAWDGDFGHERRLASQLALAVAPQNSQRGRNRIR